MRLLQIERRLGGVFGADCLLLLLLVVRGASGLTGRATGHCRIGRRWGHRRGGTRRCDLVLLGLLRRKIKHRLQAIGGDYWRAVGNRFRRWQLLPHLAIAAAIIVVVVIIVVRVQRVLDPGRQHVRQVALGRRRDNLLREDVAVVVDAVLVGRQRELVAAVVRIRVSLSRGCWRGRYDALELLLKEDKKNYINNKHFNQIWAKKKRVEPSVASLGGRLP